MLVQAGTDRARETTMLTKVTYSTKYFDSENPDEMPHFIRVCSVFYDNIDLQRKRYIINCNPSRYSMGHPDFTLWNIELFLVV